MVKKRRTENEENIAFESKVKPLSRVNLYETFFFVRYKFVSTFTHVYGGGSEAEKIFVKSSIRNTLQKKKQYQNHYAVK